VAISGNQKRFLSAPVDEGGDMGGTQRQPLAIGERREAIRGMRTCG